MTTPAGRPTIQQRRRRTFAVLGVLVVVVILVLVVVDSSSGPASSTSTTTTTPVAHHSHVKLTAGAFGREASWVLNENKHPGTTAWQIPASNQANVIAGFANKDDASQGQKVTFYVTTPSPSYTVTAYRMGWYQGKGGREIWHATKALPGRNQPLCQFTAGVNLVSCANWAPSFDVSLTTAFVQGDYLFKLVASTGQESYVPLTISDPQSRATYLFINRNFTEEGWNTWGGYDFYQGLGTCTPTYPVCNRARVVSYDRPYDTGNGASDFFGNEYPLLAFAEHHGLDVTYVTDTKLDAEPALESNHKVLLSLGHDETWSTPQRQGLETAEAHGTNLVFFGAAAVLRHVRMEPSPLGPRRLEVNYRNSTEDPLNGVGNPLDVTGNTFASPPTSWSEIPLTGQEYSGYLNGTANVPFVVTQASSWIFDLTGLKNGDTLGGVVMSDFDHVSQSAGSPSNVQIVSHSPIPANLAYTNQGTWNGLTYADMSYYTDPTSHAGIIDTGTVNWINSLSTCAPGATGCQPGKVQRITGNILRLFGEGPAGLKVASEPNWSGFQPTTS